MEDYMFFNLLKKIKELFIFTGSYSNNVFLEPLSEEEEKIALKEMREGNNDARNRLIEHNLRLVAHIVKKFDSKNVEQDDLISIGTIGLIKGVDTFNKSHGTKLTTYCARCIENAHLTLWNFMTYSKQHLKHYKVKCKQVIA